MLRLLSNLNRLSKQEFNQMDAETVRFNVTMKIGGAVYLKGEILKAPLPPLVISELRHNTGLITVLARTSSIPEKTDFIQDIPIAKFIPSEPEVLSVPELPIEQDIPIPEEVVFKRRGRKPKK
jgi:hypothetical protein